MNKKKNLFFVVTGLQVINSVECIYAMNKESDFNVLIVCNKENTVRAEVVSSLNFYQWDRVIYLPPTCLLSLKSDIFKYVFNLIFSYIRINMINFKKADLIGNDITIFYRYATKKRGIDKIVFIDDGSGTINFCKENPYIKLKNPKNKFIYRFLGIEKHVIPIDIFFTAYPDFILKHKNNKQDLIANEFEYLKKTKLKQNKSDLVYFIGDPHVERGYISQEKYLQILINCKKRFGDNFIYIPRIFERENKLLEISKHVKVVRNEMPFELFIAKTEEFPKALVAYHSSVLFNVNKIFANTIDYYYIKLPEFTNDEHVAKMKLVWENLNMFAIEIKPAEYT